MSDELDERRELALIRLRRAKAALMDAEKQYSAAVIDCASVGLGNAKIARTVGVTETAIRSYLKRRKFERSSDALKRRVSEGY